jgi:hypothetical protein
MRQLKPVLQDNMQPARLQRKIYVEGSRHHAPFFILISDVRRTSALVTETSRNCTARGFDKASKAFFLAPTIAIRALGFCYLRPGAMLSRR